MKSAHLPASVYTDFHGLAELRRQAQSDEKTALYSVASQFEAMFLQMMLKTMRAAKLDDGIMDGQSMDTYYSMYDQQLALSLSENNSIGLADIIIQQLAGPSGDERIKDQADRRSSDVQVSPVPVAVDKIKATAIKLVDQTMFTSPGEFIKQLYPYAKTAAAVLGVSPGILLAQSALETGWGKHIIKVEDGKSSHNLFGIKANSSWSGEKVYAGSVEFHQGLMEKRPSWFRAYSSFEQSFRDYVDFIRDNPRYKSALETGTDNDYITNLQNSGYATDPNYADKVISIVQRDSFNKIMERLE